MSIFVHTPHSLLPHPKKMLIFSSTSNTERLQVQIVIGSLRSSLKGASQRLVDVFVFFSVSLDHEWFQIEFFYGRFWTTKLLGSR